MTDEKSSGAARKPLRRTIRGGRPVFFADPATALQNRQLTLEAPKIV